LSLEIWIAFSLAASVVLIIPGPTVVLLVSQAIAHGRRAVFPLVLGQTCGDFTAMTLSLLGLGAIMASSAALFCVLKWIGALYLVYLGLKLWRSEPDPSPVSAAAITAGRRSLFQRAYIVTALNPKSIAFFVAFLPQFISTDAAPWPQFLVLGATFLVLAASNATLYTLFAGQLGGMLRSTSMQRWFRRCGGSALIGAGVVTATLQRTA